MYLLFDFTVEFSSLPIDLRSNREFVYECIDAEVISCPGKTFFLIWEKSSKTTLTYFDMLSKIRRSTNLQNYGCLEAKKKTDVSTQVKFKIDMIF